MITKTIVRCCLILIFCGLTNQKAAAQTVLIDSIINPSSLRQLVEVLASDSLQGRFTGTEHAVKAAEFIASEFRKAGALPLESNDGYFMPFKGWTDSQIGLNVMAAIKGSSKPDEAIIFCAHYDHIGTRSTNPFKNFVQHSTPRRGDTIFNGANDNASGTSAIIHLAHYFGQLKSNERTIIFIAFSGEELGLLGSKALALPINPEQVKAVINIEMIGRARSRKKNNAYVTGSHLSNLQKLLNKKLFETDPALYGKKFFVPDSYATENLFARSDNYWFANSGIPAHTIMASSPHDAYYHSPGDEVSTINFELMSSLVKAVAISCADLVEGIETPTRINPRHIE